MKRNAQRRTVPGVATLLRPVAPTVSASGILAVTLTVEALEQLVRGAVAHALEERATAPRAGLLDRRSLAEALGCGVDTIDRLRAEGCPSVRVGDVPRFELDRVLEWLRGRSNP